MIIHLARVLLQAMEERKEVARQDLPFDPELGDPSALRFARLGDRTIIADPDTNSSLHLWNASDGSLIARARLGQTRGTGLDDADVWETAGQPVVLCGGWAGSLAVWSPATGEEHHVWVGSPIWRVRSLPGDRAVVAGPRRMRRQAFRGGHGGSARSGPR